MCLDQKVSVLPFMLNTLKYCFFINFRYLIAYDADRTVALRLQLFLS